MSKYRILSLDGGGIRGFITARLLQRLLEQHPGWLQQVDFIAGTSSGDILALALANGKKPEEIAQLYANAGHKIFDDSVWDDVRDVGKLVGAEYSNKALKRELDNVFGGVTLKELEKKVAIPAFDLDNEHTDKAKRTWKPKIFHNFSGKDSDGDFTAAKVAMYTSAAPTFFPSVDGYIDGGVFANNPSVVALAQAISHDNQPTECIDIADIVLLSVGTGVSLNFIKGKSLDWGYGQWSRPLIDILMDGVAGISDYQCKQLLGNRYQRLQIEFGPNESIKLDDVNKLDRMQHIATEYDLSTTSEWLEQHWL